MIKEYKVGNNTYDIFTETTTQIEVSGTLYDLLELEDMSGFYNTHRSSWNIAELLNSIEEDGIEEYGLASSDIQLLQDCKVMLDDHIVDSIEFIEEI